MKIRTRHRAEQSQGRRSAVLAAAVCGTPECVTVVIGGVTKCLAPTDEGVAKAERQARAAFGQAISGTAGEGSDWAFYSQCGRAMLAGVEKLEQEEPEQRKRTAPLVHSACWVLYHALGPLSPIYDEELYWLTWAWYRSWRTLAEDDDHACTMATFCARRWLEVVCAQERRVDSLSPEEIERHGKKIASPREERLRRATHQDHRLTEGLIRDWLLIRRMDLPTAQRLEAAAHHQSSGCLPGLAGVRSMMACWCTPVAVAGLLGAVLLAACGYASPALATTAVGIAALWLMNVTLAWPRGGRVWAPRLLASAVIGWLALSSSWIWEYTERAAWWQLLLWAVLAVGACSAYLYTAEVCRHVRRMVTVPWKRTGYLLALGWCHSLSAGTVGMLLASPAIQRSGGVPVGAAHRLWPGELLFLSCLALLLGIIAQTLWEREAVTEPL